MPIVDDSFPPKPPQGRTGWPAGLLQDDCRALARWFASKLDARQRVREAAAAIELGKNPGKNEGDRGGTEGG